MNNPNSFTYYNIIHIYIYGKHATFLNKGNNKITELRAILQRESPNS